MYAMLTGEVEVWASVASLVLNFALLFLNTGSSAVGVTTPEKRNL